MPVAKVTIVNIGTVSMNKFWGERERVRSATATCTLVEVGGRRLLVDPSPHPDTLEPMLFARTGLRPAQIDTIFVTHFHGDHRYGLELFPGAAWLMAEAGLKEWRESSPQDASWVDRFVEAEGHLPDGVSLFASPGHTYGHHSLLAEADWGNTIVSGDAVMSYDWFRAQEGYHNCVDFGLARETIQRIGMAADLVIPGHGNWFLTGSLRASKA
jgi:glyoxylase-like metal-dependent hydrolase (beta-lactamase superfamily II)